MNVEKIAWLEKIFLQSFPEFSSFAHPGAQYLESEENYKRRLIEEYQERLAIIATDGMNRTEEFKKIFSWIIDEAEQNFINRRDKALIKNNIMNNPKKKAKFFNHLYKISVSAKLDKETLNHDIDKFSTWWETTIAGAANLSKLLTCLFAGISAPDKYFWMTPDIWDQFCREIGETPTGRGKFITAEMFQHMMSIGHRAKELISKLQPRDMIDVQSFIFCVIHELNMHKKKKSIQQKDLAHQDPKKSIHKQRNTPLNAILYGPPGTGKTYEARKTAVTICYPVMG